MWCFSKVTASGRPCAITLRGTAEYESPGKGIRSMVTVLTALTPGGSGDTGNAKIDRNSAEDEVSKVMVNDIKCSEQE